MHFELVHFFNYATNTATRHQHLIDECHSECYLLQNCQKKRGEYRVQCRVLKTGCMLKRTLIDGTAAQRRMEGGKNEIEGTDEPLF